MLSEITLTSIPGILQVKHLTQQELKFSQLRALSWQHVSKECWLLKHAVIAFNMLPASASVGRNLLGEKKKTQDISTQTLKSIQPRRNILWERATHTKDKISL